MININLLPWRTNVREDKKKREKFLFLLSIVLISTVFFSARYFYANSKKQEKIIQILPVKQKPSLHWVGYLEDQNGIFGLVKIGDGQVIAAQPGIMIDGRFRVVHVNHDGMVMVENGKKEYISDVV